MGFQSYIEAIEREKDLIFQDVLDNTWTKTQLELRDKGDEMFDLGIEMINDDMDVD